MTTTGPEWGGRPWHKPDVYDPMTAEHLATKLAAYVDETLRPHGLAGVEEPVHPADHGRYEFSVGTPASAFLVLVIPLDPS